MSLLTLASVAMLAACNNEAKQQLAVVSHVDSLRTDSLSSVRKELVDEVMVDLLAQLIEHRVAPPRSTCGSPDFVKTLGE